MGHYLLSADTSFSAAHTLPGVDMCERFHGHNWTVRLTVRIDQGALDEKGMGIDFRVIEEVARGAVADFEHSYLNEVPAFRDMLPTAENLARLVHERASASLAARNPAASVHEIEIRETDRYCVVYRP